MNIREEQEKYEHEHLSRFASFSDESQGRDTRNPVGIWEDHLPTLNTL